jgi:hypothetical protein
MAYMLGPATPVVQTQLMAEATNCRQGHRHTRPGQHLGPATELAQKLFNVRPLDNTETMLDCQTADLKTKTCSGRKTNLLTLRIESGTMGADTGQALWSTPQQQL